jgi:hypothetical protein
MPRVEYRADVVQLATRIPTRLHRAVKLAAIEEGSRVCDWVADALAAYLRELGGTAADESDPQPTPTPRRRAAHASA